MLAHGFTVELMVELVRAGLATATTEPIVASGYRGETTRVRITEAGRQTLAESAKLRTAAAGGRDALANLSFREIQKFATIRVSSGAIRRIPVHRKRSPFDV
jgi:hypothetical protein